MGEGSMSRLMAPRGIVIETTGSHRARGKSLKAVGRAIAAVAAGGASYHPAVVGHGRGATGCVHAGGDGQSAN